MTHDDVSLQRNESAAMWGYIDVSTVKRDRRD
jgi:hypothetical protein